MSGTQIAVIVAGVGITALAVWALYRTYTLEQDDIKGLDWLTDLKKERDASRSNSYALSYNGGV